LLLMEFLKRKLLLELPLLEPLWSRSFDQQFCNFSYWRIT
jgi:hypothetical protein